MSYEIGKNRLESLGDVAETVEFLRYYAGQITEHEGFITPLSAPIELLTPTPRSFAPSASGRSSRRSTSRWRLPAAPVGTDHR